jgi:hypothetical protein
MTEKLIKAAAEWASIDEESRLTIPAEITDCLSWFTPKKKMAISIDLTQPRLIVIRHLPEVQESLRERRDSLPEESENSNLGLRRVAMTHHFFREATLVVPERRIGLKAVILDHLDSKPTGRLFCLAYADRIEAYNELAARDLISRHANDFVMASDR